MPPANAPMPRRCFLLWSTGSALHYAPVEQVPVAQEARSARTTKRIVVRTSAIRATRIDRATEHNEHDYNRSNT